MMHSRLLIDSGPEKCHQWRVGPNYASWLCAGFSAEWPEPTAASRSQFKYDSTANVTDFLNDHNAEKTTTELIFQASCCRFLRLLSFVD